mmetsp:Transcript_43458/g.113039  ORF Transcript_43458/g.113039 Transcript_43458/m.113039 type:complete len:295 (-) Transcript_43458:127-1011(-)
MTPRILRQDSIANLTIGKYGGDQGGSCSSIRQIVKYVEDNQKMQAVLMDLQYLWAQPGAATGRSGKVVIFTNRRLQANTLSNCIAKQGIKCGHLHGKLEQQEREEVVENFRRGICEVLVATNVASRGLDFPDISLVVQYDMPATIDIYTHRIGRTGRVGQVGCALAYVGRKDLHLGQKLVEFLVLNSQQVPDFLRQHAPKDYVPGRGPAGGAAAAEAQQAAQPRFDLRDGGRQQGGGLVFKNQLQGTPAEGGLVFKNQLQEAATQASAVLAAGGPAGAVVSPPGRSRQTSSAWL